MESHGAILTCLDSHNNHDAVYKFVVMDNNSLSKNILGRNLDTALAARLIDEYPRTKGGGKQKSTGQIPVTHPLWKKLANHNHCNRCMVVRIYNFARMPKAKSACTPADAERLKHNATYAVHEYETEDFETFKRMVWAVLYHHFGFHFTCNIHWFRWIQCKDNPVELEKLYYRCRDKDAALC
jgi:hypothetical protein